MIEFDLSKLLQTSGLVRKKVLVRKKGGAPFWSTRWVQAGADIKQVMTSLGFEVVEEDKPEEIKKDTYKVPEIIKEKVPDIAGYLDAKTEEINQLNKKLVNLVNLVESLHGKSNIDDQVNIDNVKRRIKDAINNRESMEKRILASISEKPEPEIVIPEPVVEVKPEVPETVQETLVPIIGDFVPSTTVAAAIERIGDQFVRPPSDEAINRNLTFHFDYGVDLKSLKLDGINSIINGFEKTIGKYGIKLDYVGWNKRKQSVAAMYARDFGDLHHAIKFQKTATKNVKKTKKDSIEQFGINKRDNIEKMQRYLTYKEMRPGDRDRNRARIAKYEACDRWTVDCSSEDPLAVTAAHEGCHVVYHKYELESKWEDNLTYLVGDKMQNDLKCATVSEYGMSSIVELFAEVGAAVAFDIEIDPDVKQAYLDTVGGINR